nr:PREDICTED: snRNA-activating protein complex subunit 2 [Paralichthys olivaceus]
MKPPPRIRNKPGRILTPDVLPPSSGKVSHNWKRSERRKLLKALTTLSETPGGRGDIDYAVLGKQVSTRSIPEIQYFVDGLKDKVISYASFYLKNKDQMVRKPIEMWTHLASAVTGTLKEPIWRAFSQMLKVSSTEPRTLRNGAPSQVHRLSKVADRHVGRSISQRPMLSLPVQGKRPGTNPAPPFLVFKTPAPTKGGRAKRGPVLSNVVRLPISKIPPPQQPPSNTAATLPAATCSAPTAVTSYPPGIAELAVPPTNPQLVSQTVIPVKTCSNTTAGVKTVNVDSIVKQQPSTIFPLKSTSSSPGMPLALSATGLVPFPSTAPSSVKSAITATNHPVAPLSTPTAASPSGFGCTRKYATKLSPRTISVNSSVDFERLYHYMSAMHESDDERPLTPMESAIMLNLLMSLPEELSLLHCTKLQKHLIQVQLLTQ